MKYSMILTAILLFQSLVFAEVKLRQDLKAVRVTVVGKEAETLFSVLTAASNSKLSQVSVGYFSCESDVQNCWLTNLSDPNMPRFSVSNANGFSDLFAALKASGVPVYQFYNTQVVSVYWMKCKNSPEFSCQLEYNSMTKAEADDLKP